MLLLSDGDINYYDVITWLYIDTFKIDSDISTYGVRYRRVEHNTWPSSPKKDSAAALNKVIEETKRKQTER